MATTEQIEQWLSEFDEEYPEELPQRFQWLVDRLGISPRHVLRLMGLSPDDVSQLISNGEVDWSAAISQASEESAWLTESLIVHLLSRFHYDWKALHQSLRQPPPRELEVPLLGGKMVSISRLDPRKREDALLSMIAQDGPYAHQAFMTYLAQAATAPACS
jgi:hypothetical protein